MRTHAPALVAIALSCCVPHAMPTPEYSPQPAIAIVGGTIHTMDPARPLAEVAVAVDGRFTCVGSRDECNARIPPHAVVVDLKGGAALPGLADAHGHVASLGFSILDVNLTDCESEEACASRIRERANLPATGAWIVARGWDQNRWPGKKMPTADVLSRWVPDHAVIATRVDGHAVWVNARALSIAGIDRSTPDPPGGRILRDKDAAPTGVLVDNAEDLVRAKVPPRTDAEIEAAIRSAIARLQSLGITSAHDAGVDARTLAIYRRLAETRQLGIHVYAMIDGQRPMSEVRAQMDAWRASPRVGRLTVGAVKLYADGALGSRGALLFDPYSDEPATTGLAVTPHDDLRARILDIARTGFQPAVHAIGDRAVHEVLEDFAEATLRGAPDLRPRVEHLQVMDPRDVELLARSRAVASMQPTHATSDGPWAEERLGRGTDRRRGAYAWRSVLDAHVALACGSDFPVESPDPIAGLRSAVLRTWPGGPEDGWMPEQKMTLDEAVRCFTIGAAYAERAENERGRIAVGYVADAVTFDADPFTVGADRIGSVRRTIVEGAVAWEAGR